MGRRIAMILDMPFPHDARVEREALALVEEGHDVFLWAFSAGGYPEKFDWKGIQVTTFKPSIWDIKFSALANDWPLYHFLMRKHLLKFLKVVKPDVTHVHDIVIANAVFKLKANAGKIVLDLHENRPEIMKHYPHLHRFPGNILISPNRWKRVERDLVAGADAVVVVTQEAKEEYSEWNRRVYTVPNTLSMSMVDDISIDEAIVERFKNCFGVVYIGDLGRRRGIMDALKAINELKREVPEIRLVLVGDSSQMGDYQEYIEANSLHEYVSLEGFQPYAKLFSYIKACQVGISPLHRNAHHDTTFANKIFQYMSMGVPQVVSDCPAQARVVMESNAGLVHRAEDYHDLAKKLLNLYKNSDEAKAMGENGERAIRDEWEWGKQQKDLLRLYTEI
ncbi:glycosyltransferase family 4 protein [Marinoscillum furvescens]|uniref:Glycosyltransferase involved in cell wall biosynthesis n=1 Tax=Marinoscillum furvescens DSM 4134 TaxID=1122208 RepID=A0A3D9L0C7_MARFU|nr:glycosyltransferase family 4 protein [Marinoscillum furvescens]RED96629.1 glycosyltransferase involved in cell wall biosynthesis [Marinoscillum furvescens DSM 4134]